MRSKPFGSKVVMVAFAANLAIAVTKFTAAVLTGSSAMLSEGIHSLVDTVNEVLLLYGMSNRECRAQARCKLGILDAERFRAARHRRTTRPCADCGSNSH